MQKQSDNASQFAILSLAKLVQLLSAELVAGSHRDDVDRLERAIREKIGQIDTSAFTTGAAEKGLHYSRALIEQVLVQVREQAKSAVKSSPPERRDAEKAAQTLH